MEPQLILLGGAGALLMGVTLGVFGAGGSILTVPLLTFLLAYPPTLASHYSLLVVGVVSAFGVLLQWHQGNLRPGRAALFALPAMAGMFLVKKFLLPALPSAFSVGGRAVTLDQLILASFAVFMILAAGSMILVKVKEDAASDAGGAGKAFLLGGAGLLTGAVAGFVGAGGGFLIVPALVFLGGMPVKEASRASLLVIALNSLWGFAVGTRNWAEIPFAPLSLVAGLALLGMFAGVKAQARIPATRLKPAFGFFVLAMGIYILARVS